MAKTVLRPVRFHPEFYMHPLFHALLRGLIAPPVAFTLQAWLACWHAVAQRDLVGIGRHGT